MAVGDIVAVEIGADGWFADITIEGLDIGGTYAARLGLGTNNTPETGTPLIVFNVTSKGFDDAGAATTLERTVLGTIQLRTPATTNYVAGSYTSGTFQEGETVTQAGTGATGIVVIPASAGTRLYIRTITGTPNNSGVWTGGTSSATFTPTAVPVDYATGPREFDDGTNLKVRVALSEYIYAKDKSGSGNSGTDVTVDIGADFYDDGVNGNNAATGFAVTNNSTAPYQDAVINWSWPGYHRVTGTFKLRALAFHRDGQQGRPVRMVRFEVTDGTNTETVDVTGMTIDPDMSDDAVPLAEYVAEFNAADFTDNAVITANFKAFPWIGDAATDSSTGAAAPSPAVGPLKLLADSDDDYGVTMAKVNATSGNDGTGVAYDSASYDYSTAAAFATIGAAAAAIATYNNTNRSRNNCGAGIIELTEDTHQWMGGTFTTGGTSDTWLTVRAGPGTARANVILDGPGTNTRDAGDRIKWEGITVIADANSVFNGIEARWFHDCVWNSTANSPLATTGALVQMTHCSFVDLSQGLRPFSTNNVGFGLIRGCTFDGFNDAAQAYTVIGNRQTSKYVSASRWTNQITGQTTPTCKSIIYNNDFRYWQVSGSSTAFNLLNLVAVNGCAIVQNLWECTVNATAGLGTLGGSNPESELNNIIVWHNLFLGQRVQTGYNDSGTATLHRRYWSVKNNYWDVRGYKSDTFGTAHGARTGNWPLMFGVAHSGDCDAGIDDIAADAFSGEYDGLYSYRDNSATAGTWAQFDGPLRYDGTERAGGGDYHIADTSPMFARANDWLIPYDLEGAARGDINESPGVYSTSEREIAPASLEVDVALGTPAVTPGPVSAAPSSLTVSVTFGAPTVTPGPVVIAPSSTEVQVTFGTPAVVAIGPQSFTPDSLEVDVAFGAPTVSPGSVSIAPSSLTINVTFGAPAVTPGAVVVAPGSLEVGVSFGSPAAIQGAAIIAPASLQVGVAFGAPGVGSTPAAVNIWTAARREKQWRAERRETEWEALPS